MPNFPRKRCANRVVTGENKDGFFMRLAKIRAAVAALAWVAALSLPGGARAQSAPTWPQVQELFSEKCTLCHSGEDAPLGLRLHTLESALKGSENGSVLKAGTPGESELIRRVRGESEPRMPLTGPPFLSDGEIAMLEQWVAAGLPAGQSAAVVPERPQLPRPGPDKIATMTHVESIFLKRCVKCHKDNGKMGSPPEGLRLDSYANIIAGGERLVILPGNPGLSEIIRRVEGKARPRMPFDGPPWLSDDDARLLRQWIEQGARDADGNRAPVPTGREVRFRGKMTGRWSIDGVVFKVDGRTRIDKSPQVGDQIEVRGTVDPSGQVRAYRLRRR